MQTVMPKIVLIGLESVGKSALFRALTGEASGDEQNVRGSTVTVRSAPLRTASAQMVDTPGIRLSDDSLTSRLALEQLNAADTVLLVVRGTHAQTELAALLRELGAALGGRNTALVFTFEDRATPELATLRDHYATQLGVPVALVNARAMTDAQHIRIEAAIQAAAPLARPTAQTIVLLPNPSLVQPQPTIFEHPQLGPWVAVLAIALLFALPVYLAYQFADWLQPHADAALIEPLTTALAPLEQSLPLLFAALVGDYGLLTLGWYSFLWAFPVVLLIGVSVAVTEESGLKDRITAALDPWLRRIGLSGRDLVPVLSGFGCNVVAVFQTRSCSVCTRKACLSLIAFGSACSYQIGASLSIFNAAREPWLFAPYLLVVFLVGAIHTRIWHGGLAPAAAAPISERAFLQRPGWRGVWWRVRGVLRQFLLQAMPIFLVICAVGALLAFIGLLDGIAAMVGPALAVFGLPGQVAPGVIFAIIRKDGLLVLNEGEGALLATLSAGQILVLVYLASTLTACLVTLWTIGKELGVRHALVLAGRQAATALVSALLLALIVQGLALLAVA